MSILLNSSFKGRYWILGGTENFYTFLNHNRIIVISTLDGSVMLFLTNKFSQEEFIPF